MNEASSICLVSPVSGAANGGTASYIRHLGDNLAALGKNVSGVSRLLLRHQVGASYAEHDLALRDSQQCQFEGWRTQLIGPSPWLAPLLKAVPSLVSRGGGRKAGKALFGAVYEPQIAGAIPAEVDVVHYIGTGWEMMGFPTGRIARRRGAVLSVTPFVHPGTWGNDQIDIDFYNQADCVFVCTDYERNHLVKLGVERRRMVKVGMAPASQEGGDAARFRERHHLGTRPLVFFLARKQKYKGYHALLQAMTRVIAAVPDVCLVVAGPDGERPYPSIPEGNFLDLGELKPGVGDRDKADALAACDIYCMPSTAEAFGIVYVEAWSYGKPVIGGTAPALQELIAEGVDGYCVDQDERNIAERLILLLTNPELRARLGANGQLKQRERFTWNAVTEGHLEAWKHAMKHKPESDPLK